MESFCICVSAEPGGGGGGRMCSAQKSVSGLQKERRREPSGTSSEVPALRLSVVVEILNS